MITAENSGESNAQRFEPLPLYRSHKIVQAAKIKGIRELRPQVFDGRGEQAAYPSELHFEGPHRHVTVSEEYVAKHKPRVGGYYVRYDDGYDSWSPAKAFEAGYALVEPSEPTGLPGGELTHDWGLPLSQETKYDVDARGRLVNRVSGESIPDDEPVMIFRAKDARSIPILQGYVDQLQAAGLTIAAATAAATLERFVAFQNSHADRVRDPN